MADVKISIDVQEALIAIQEQFLPQFRRYVRRTEKRVAEAIREELKKGVLRSDFWLSLHHGSTDQLGAHFGFEPDTQFARLGTILETWLESLRIEFVVEKSRSRQITEGRIQIINNFADIFTLDEAIVKNFNKTRGVELLPWLKWLLLEGNNTIITDYHIKYGTFANSRSGGAVMTPQGSWSVPDRFAGTESDNVLTRTITDVLNQTETQQRITKILQEEA